MNELAENEVWAFAGRRQGLAIKRFKSRSVSNPRLMDCEVGWAQTPPIVSVEGKKPARAAIRIDQRADVSRDQLCGETYLTPAMPARDNALTAARRCSDERLQADERIFPGPFHPCAVKRGASRNSSFRNCLGLKLE